MKYKTFKATSLTPTAVSLSLDNWTISNDTDWTISLTAGVLTAEYTGSGTVDHSASATTACYMVLNKQVLIAAENTMYRHLEQALLVYDGANISADGIGVGVGFVNNPSVSQGVFTIARRDGAGTITLDGPQGESTDKEIGTGITPEGGILLNMTPQVTSAAAWDTCEWDLATGVGTNQSSRGGAISGLGGGDNIYLALCFVAATNPGTVDVSSVGLLDLMLKRIGGI